MMEIIPSINVRTFEEVRERIKKVEPYVNWCHLDITDGVFSKHPTWHDPRDLVGFRTSLQAEVHLMVAEPEKIVESWLVGPIKRVIMHLEAAKDPELIIQKCREARIEVGFAINPETFWGKFKPWFGKADIYQILAVHPGPSGQEVDWPEILGKTRHLHEECPHCIIEVDGGVNPASSKAVLDAGASLLVAGNYIFNQPDIRAAVKTLQEAAIRQL